LPPPEHSGRRSALAWWLLLTVGLVGVVAVTTPWDWLPGAELGPVDPTAGLTPEQLDRIAAYRRQMVPLSVFADLAGLALVGYLGLTRRGARLVRRLPGARWWWLQLGLAVPLVLLLVRIATLVPAIRVEQVRREFGLSTQSWAGWAEDLVTAFGVAVVTLWIFALVVVGSVRTVQRWWFPASILAAALVVVGGFLYPVIVAPLFARVTPMSAGPLRTSLLDLAARDGVAVEDVLVADASNRTTQLNAYVSGFGPTKRIVVYDTLLATATPDEVRLVVAHELGHAERHDVLRGTLVAALGTAAGVALLALLLESPWVRRTAGYGRPRDTAVVPAVLALVSLGSFLALPAQNVISRAVEARADVHALDLTRDPKTFAAVQRRLAVTNLSSPHPPGPLYLWYASHPTVAQRLALAEGWAAAAGLASPSARDRHYMP